MHIITPDSPLPDTLRGAVAAIGNFDGAHRGHAILFELARRRAKDIGAPFIILTFAPHPRRFFMPDTPAFLLTPGDLKYERLAESLADGVVVLRFDAALAALTATEFIEGILKKRLGVAHVVTGRDFRFGHKRAGTIENFFAAGLPATAIDVMTDRTGTPYTSGTVRNLLQQGDIDAANRMLGWEWEIHGTVVRGDQRGRALGYPTANVRFTDGLRPSYGIYAGWVGVAGETFWRPSALSIGIRPMFATPEALLEAHILDFTGDIYGCTLRVRPVKKLRDEAKFPDLTALKTQMAEDCVQARALLAQIAQAA